MNIKDPLKKQGHSCIIWLHGLGASAQDMSMLAAQLPQLPVRHIFLDAPLRKVTINNGLMMPAWYDLDFNANEDEPGILASAKMIQQTVQEQQNCGFPAESILLAGFSQGGAMALHTALTMNQNLGGVIMLSGYLPLSQKPQILTLAKNTSFFVGFGIYDQIVLPEWTKNSIAWLRNNGYHNINEYQYPMEHSVCSTEIKDLAVWLAAKTVDNI